nr:PhzF family phenazine biosynthesis protein [uncultured Sphingomonas sp.]
MTSLPFYQVDAFATKPFEGNPAAVMPLDAWLADDVMQAIAAENNLSETAFLVPSGREDADYDLRWFTPTTEVDLCGHATLASAHIVLTADQVRFATRSGILTVTRNGNGYALDLPAGSVAPAANPEMLAALGLPDEMPLFIGSGGNGAAIVLLPDEGAVRAVAPNHDALKPFDQLVMVTAKGAATDIVSRVFASYHGIDEDPVTGSAHASLVPFWATRLRRNAFSAYQASARGGRLDCELAGDRVILTGGCITTIEGVFRV